MSVGDVDSHLEMLFSHVPRLSTTRRLQIKKDDGEKLSEKHERILHWMSYFEKKQEAAVVRSVSKSFVPSLVVVGFSHTYVVPTPLREQDAMMKSGDETMAKADKSMKEGDEFMAQVKKEMNEEEGDFNEWLDAVDSSDAILEKMMNCDDEEKLAVLKTKMESLIAKMDAATVGDDDGDN